MLAGLTVLIEERNRNYDAAYRELQRCSVTTAWHDRGGLSFPVRDIAKLATTTATIIADEDLKGMWEYIKDPSADGVPATLHSKPYGAQLQWVSASGVNHAAVVPQNAIPALLASGIAFVAESEAWRFIEQHATVPVVAGHVQLNADGFLEIHTSTPQLVESSPLPGLFRLDDTHYGMPSALSLALEAARGFVWDSQRPAGAHKIAVPASLDITDHAHRHAALIASQLEAYKAAAVVWSPGLGRRIAVLAALEALDAWPLLIVCAPHTIWLWQRHIELVDRECSLAHNDTDVRIVTYRDLRRIALEDPVAVIFDDPFSAEARAARDACHRLDGLRDAYRVSVSSSWPTDQAMVLQAMSLLRPVEFRSDLPAVWRYPVRTDARLEEHVGVYRMELSATDVPPAATARFRRSSVAVCEPTTEQLATFLEYQDLLERDEEDPSTLLALAREAATAGTSGAPSPKLAEAITRVRQAIERQRTVAVVVSSAKAAARLRILLKPTIVHLADEIDGVVAPPLIDEVTIVRATGNIPSLRAFDEVVVCEYPTSFAALDRAIGPAHGEGPQKVTLIHLARSIDDRLAVSASLAREAGLAVQDEDPYWLLQLRD